MSCQASRFTRWIGRNPEPNPCVTNLFLRPEKLRSSDFDEFDYILAMDRSNLSDLQREMRRKPEARAKVKLFGEYSGTGRAEAIGDPYYGGRDGFEKAYEQVTRFSRTFLEEVFPDVKAEP